MLYVVQGNAQAAAKAGRLGKECNAALRPVQHRHSRTADFSDPLD